MSKTKTSEIALNFYPILEQDFEFGIFRVPYSAEIELPTDQDCHKYALPDDDGKYRDYWISLEQIDHFEPYTCTSRTNNYLTLLHIFDQLRKSTESNLPRDKYRIEERFGRKIYFCLSTYPEGRQEVWLQPYLLRRSGQFGFLSDFSFRKAPDYEYDRRVQQLSLSKDKHYRENTNFYRDRFRMLRLMMQQYYSNIFPLQEGTLSPIDISQKLVASQSSALDVKRYEFGNGNVQSSQFMGIKRNGPYQGVGPNPQVYFIYDKASHKLSQDLYLALSGRTYPTFPGMRQMFRCQFDTNNVNGIELTQFTVEEVTKAIYRINRDRGRQSPVAVLLTPWSKRDATDEESDDYYRLKHAFLEADLPAQFVSTSLIRNKQTFKWSISNIGLAMFAKMGGIPWRVKPRTERCLIIGIGQAHDIRDGELQKFFAYSVLTDSSGVYIDLKVLSQSQSEATYLDGLKRELRNLIEEYSDQYSRFAIHTTFRMRYRDMEAIKDVIHGADGEDQEREFVVIKVNESSEFFGFAPGNNSMIPYESSFITLSNSQFLVWFEGLQYHNPNVSGRIAQPVYLDIIYPTTRPGGTTHLSEIETRDYLQDALNLSGANWRGFNAKSLPVSVLYAGIIAKDVSNFSSLDLSVTGFDNITPWFL